jgi:hypothetical protein
MLVSNCDGLGEAARPTAGERFTVSYVRASGHERALAVAISPDATVPPRRLAGLHELARSQASGPRLCGQAVFTTRRLADETVLVGRDPTSVHLPVNPADHVVAFHHVNGPRAYLPNHVVSTHAVTSSFRGVTVGALDPAGNPALAIPSVCRNGDCPCASGRKYKRCHGLTPGTPGFGYPQQPPLA